MGRLAAKLIIGFSAVVGLLLVALLAWTLRRPAPGPALPNPNGYDDFLKASHMLTVDFSDYRDLEKETLRTELEANAEALRVARLGLSRECRVPTDPSRNMTNHLVELPMLRRLSFAFAAEGRLAELENRPSEAAKAYADGISFGIEATRGGVIIDVLVGIALEAVGTVQLERLNPSLDAKTCRATAAALESIDAKRDSPEVMIQQEKDWVRRSYGMSGQIQRIVSYKSIAATERSTKSKWARQMVRLRSLTVALAARAFELEKGQRPANLTDLVPSYLKSVPLDPLSGTSLAVRP